MKTEAEIRALLEECDKAMDASDGCIAEAELCPLGNGCCPECNFMSGLDWVLGVYKLPREIFVKTVPIEGGG